uniref:Uncharacterized protein n=1 Tax=uncultured bacterium fosmid pJB28H11 TaxID=1478062 RepID=A0A0H3U7Q5_9BACT|nr:hypothetical protein [uncultured bacterium fosmid pJB28H11]
MKKIIAVIVSVVLAAGFVHAQDLEEVTNLFNEAATALNNGDKTAALDQFNKVLELATALGDEGNDIASNCKTTIPKIVLSIAKDLVKAEDYDNAVTKLKEAAAFEDADVASEANELIPQVIKQKGASLLKDKDYAGAAEVFKGIVAENPEDGASALRLGQALNALGNSDEAIAAFEKAAANGQEGTANKQISNIYLKKAAASLKEKAYADAVASAVKACDYAENSQAWQIAGQASQLAGKNADAINYFEKYLEAAPSAKNAGQIAYTIGALYQTNKNNDKAKEYYTKALSDPKYGAEAKKLLDALK